MQYTISAATLLALVSAVQAQTAGFDAITKPSKDEVVSACANYVINWQYTAAYPGTVTIQLLHGATPGTLQLGDVIASKFRPSSIPSLPIWCAYHVSLILTTNQAALTTPSVPTPGPSAAPWAPTPPTASRSPTTPTPLA